MSNSSEKKKLKSLTLAVVKVVFKRWRSCGVYGERGARAYSLVQSSHWGPGTKPLVRGSGAEPPEGDDILIADAKTRLKLEI